VIALATEAASKSFFIRASCKLFAGAIAGAAAYLLADLDVIGVKLDTSSPRTFCILSFLFAYIGLDVLMNRFAIARQEAGKEPIKTWQTGSGAVS